MSKSLVHSPPGEAPIALGMTFDERPEFFSTVGRAVAGGGVGAFLAHTLGRTIGLADSFSLLVTFVMTGALVLISAREKSASRTLIGAVLGLLGGILHTQYGGNWPVLGALMLGAVAAPVLARGEPPIKMAATGLFTGLMLFGGVFVASVLQSAGVFGGLLPEALGAAAAGSAAGLFLGLGSAPRHVVPAEDPVESAYLGALLSIEGELADILQRALAIYQAVRDDLEGRELAPEHEKLGLQVGEMSMRILRITERCRAVEDDLEAASADDLEARIDALSDKADATEDPAAQATLRGAIESLEEQRAALGAIGRGTERVVARLHANVALLEKVRFSLVHLKSADIERHGNQTTPLDAALDELGRELDATSHAVTEVYGADGPKSLESAIDRAGGAAAAPQALLPALAPSDSSAAAGVSTVEAAGSDDLSDALPGDEER